MNILTLIPARHGSKGVPGKNIKPLNGKPLIVYTIQRALESKYLTKVVVSTDDRAIRDLSIKAGAEAPFLRPTHLAQDETPTFPVIQHALNFYTERGIKFDAVCLLQPTSPFRPEGFIDQAIIHFIATDSDSLISVIQVPHQYNPHWVFEPNEEGLLEIATGENTIIPRRQELPPAFIRDGAIYLTKTKVLLEDNSLYGQKISFIESNPDNHVNIDSQEDWALAEEKASIILMP